MTVQNKVLTLIDEIEKAQSVLRRADAFYRDYIKREMRGEDRKPEHAIVIGEVFCNYHTCLETVFLRISQFFENDLAKEKWHQDLLHKMTLDVEGVRSRVISDATFSILFEFLKFRHFRRYYFEFNYDWDRIQYLQTKYDQLLPVLEEDLKAFVGFLRRLLDAR